jgi:hypothetical protein
MFNYKVLFALLIAMSPVALKAVPIVESDFGSDSSTITFDGLGLPFENGSLNLNGQDISSNSGSVRYGDYGVCPGECVGTDLGVDWIDVAFDTPYERVGALVNGVPTLFFDNVRWSVRASFFGIADALLGSYVVSGTDSGAGTDMVFAGWEDASGITKMRLEDISDNRYITVVDNVKYGPTVNGPVSSVPEPGTLALLSLGLLGLGVTRKRRAA